MCQRTALEDFELVNDSTLVGFWVIIHTPEIQTFRTYIQVILITYSHIEWKKR